MKAEPVDVIISTRGSRPEMLAEAVRSVREQDHPGVVTTTVVYDLPELPADALSDDDPHRPVRSTTNVHARGLAGARNSGVALAASEWVAFLDDDDLWLPRRLSAQLSLAAATGARTLTTGIVIAHADGSRHPRPAPAEVVRHVDLLRDRLTELHPSSFLVRRDAVEAAGGVDEQLPGGYAEDYDLLLRLTRLGDVACVREPLVVVRWAGDSYFFSRWETIATALRYLLAKHPDFAGVPAGWARVTGQIAFAEAAMGHRRAALKAAAASARRNPREARAPLAAAVASGLVSADRVQRALHARGRGI